jgi:AbrB family looped-hinge helix DNA binding protein
MPTATMTSKGQITVPAEVRKRLGLTTGSRVSFIEDGDRYLVENKTVSASSLYGIVPALDRPVTLEEMDEAIIAGALESMDY